MPAYYRAPLARFLGEGADSIVGRLTSRAAGAGYYQLLHAQTAAWEVQVSILQEAAKQLVRESGAEA